MAGRRQRFELRRSTVWMALLSGLPLVFRPCNGTTLSGRICSRLISLAQQGIDCHALTVVMLPLSASSFGPGVGITGSSASSAAPGYSVDGSLSCRLRSERPYFNRSWQQLKCRRSLRGKPRAFLRSYRRTARCSPIRSPGSQNTPQSCESDHARPELSTLSPPSGTAFGQKIVTRFRQKIMIHHSYGPYTGESPQDYAKRLLDWWYGKGGWSDKGPGTEFNELVKNASRRYY